MPPTFPVDKKKELTQGFVLVPVDPGGQDACAPAIQMTKRTNPVTSCVGMVFVSCGRSALFCCFQQWQKLASVQTDALAWPSK
jgi:hypothetical protein